MHDVGESEGKLWDKLRFFVISSIRKGLSIGKSVCLSAFGIKKAGDQRSLYPLFFQSGLCKPETILYSVTLFSRSYCTDTYQTSDNL
jgi:hypothetical protein